MMRTPRAHNAAHLEFIRGLSCCVCGNNIQTEAAHVKMSCDWADKRGVGLGEKADDKFTVPLCGQCHRDQHNMDEREFWIARGKDPVCIALALWSITGNHERGERIALCSWEDLP
jgi:hypothetical protein